MDLKSNLDSMHNIATLHGKSNFVAHIRKFAKKFLKHKPSEELEREINTNGKDEGHYDRLVKIMYSILKIEHVWDAPFYKTPQGEIFRKEDEMSKRDKEYIMSKVVQNDVSYGIVLV